MNVRGGKTGKPLGHSSLRLALLSLRLVYAWGIEQRWLTHNPAASVKVPKVASKVGRDDHENSSKVWTPEQFETFRDHVDATYASGTTAAARDPWVRAGMRLTLCGLRRSEVLGLSWESVDLKTGTVAVVASRVKTGLGSQTEVGPPKTEESRRVVGVEMFQPGTRAALLELWVAQGQPASGLVILGRPVGPDPYSRHFRSRCGAAGVPDLGSIHRLRHTIAFALHSAGAAPVEGASLLGHSTATHVAFYIPTSTEAGGEAARKGAAIFSTREVAQ